MSSTIDKIGKVSDITKEASELAQHIRDSKPEETREQQMEQLVSMLDNAHAEAFNACTQLDEEAYGVDNQ